MSQGAGVPHVVCPAAIFAIHEEEIRQLTDALNHVATLREKAAMAAALREVAGRLLDCPVQVSGNVNCRLCNEFSRLRVNTAELILRTARLAT